MQLSDLPEEILIMIIKDFDLYTLESLYNTCKRLRNIVCMHGVVKDGTFSCNVMATANKLKTGFFKDTAHHLVELNLCGVPDLCKTVFIPALKKLTKLKVLDISYTNLHIADLSDLHKICPTLKDITVNLTCGECAKIPKSTILRCQAVFEHFENIHFVGSIVNLLHSKIALYLIAKATLQTLKYTIADKDCIIHIADQDVKGPIKIPHFNQFTVYVMNWNVKKTSFIPIMDTVAMNEFPILSKLQHGKYEYIIIRVTDFEPKVYASAMFQEFFKEKFNVITLDVSHSLINVYGNSAVMVWNKETTNFDTDFYNTLAEQIKQYIPFYFLLKCETPELVDPVKRDWFYNIPMSHVCERYNIPKHGVTRKRHAAPNFILNYDEVFRDRDYVELSLEFKYPTNSTISLTANSDYLRKLTFLSLLGLGRFSFDFFNNLFRCCVNLVTLNVQTLPVAPSTLAVSRSIPLSTSLKNLRLVDKRVDMSPLFSAFSQCPNLENIHVVDESIHECNNLADPTEVIEKCDALYNIYLEAQITEATKTRIMRMFNKAKAKFNKPYVNVMIQNLGQPNARNYDPFVHPFRLNPVRPLK